MTGPIHRDTAVPGLPPRPGTAQVRLVDRLARLPWWVIVILLAGVLLLQRVAGDPVYQTTFGFLVGGIATTVKIAVIAYGLAIAVGVVAGLGRVARQPVVFNVATLYVQVIRGIPIAVQIIYVALVLVPWAVAATNRLGVAMADVLGPTNPLATLRLRDISSTGRVIIALAFAYGAFEAETFRAGIESLGRGQMEAARSLGMSYLQAMRFVVLPQAVRRVLPTLGNDFISMMKDSSLGVLIAAPEVMQRAKVYSAASFQTVATYNTVAFIYLTLTLLLSLGVKWLERRYRQASHA